MMYPKPPKKEKKNKPLKKISDKRRERLGKYSEKDLFREILINKSKWWTLTCEVCWEIFTIESRISQPTTFAHIIPKSYNSKLRLFKNNIAIVCWEHCHKTVDKYVAWNKLEIEQKILNWETININDYK